MTASAFLARLGLLGDYRRRLEADNFQLRQALLIERTVSHDMARGLERITVELAGVYEEWKEADEGDGFFMTTDELAEKVLEILQHSHPDYIPTAEE